MRVRGTVVVLLLVVLTGCGGDPAAPLQASESPTLEVGTHPAVVSFVGGDG